VRGNESDIEIKVMRARLHREGGRERESRRGRESERE
jgi:hypothetical protein